MIELALINKCSPEIHPVITNAIVKTESRFNPFAIGVNKGGKAVRQPNNYQEAVAVAKNLIARGANIDMGLAQINSANLQWLGLSVEQVFDPCTNLKAMQTVYLTCFQKSGETGLGTRMQRALSCYNTGNMEKGFRNGYVTTATNYYNEYAVSFNKRLERFQLQPIQNQNHETTIKQENMDVSVKAENVKVRSFNTWDVFRDF